VSGPTLLLVEDELGSQRALAEYLERSGYEVYAAATAHEALRLWDAHRADLVLLDLGLPDLDGVDVIKRIRREATTPIIILSARGDERDKIDGLEAGADDYLTKPFATDELNARIRAVLRRAGGRDADVRGCLTLGPIELDPVRREVTVSGALVHLTPREYELLKVLLSQQGRVLTKARLLRAVWGLAYADESAYLHVYVNRLRRKLAASAGAASIEGLIETEPGIGYRVADNGSLPESSASDTSGGAPERSASMTATASPASSRLTE
jgi:two-component system KDP operon response regulator KdpE